MKLFKEKTKQVKFLADTLWSFAALSVMNVITQFVLYPILRSVLGVEEYGNVLYLIGIVNIMATSVGSGVNLARLVASSKGKTYNTDSTVCLIAMQIIALPICWIVLPKGDVPTAIDQFFWLWVLSGLTIWRYYADVEFRLKTNYKGYFVYYMAISAGYLLGVILFYLTQLWQMILVPGELAGIIYVVWKGSIIRLDGGLDQKRFMPYVKSVLSLMTAQFMVNVVLNADRLILKAFMGGEAVTLYYIASLVGKTIALISSPLNNVIIGYLVKSNQSLRAGDFLKISALGLALTGIALLVCVGGSHVFAFLFYPVEYDVVKELFWVADLAQIFYFISGVLTTILLRYIAEKFQMIINGVFFLAFAVVTVSFTKLWGLNGFSIGLLLSNAFRYFFATVLGTVELRRIVRIPSKSAIKRKE